LEPKPWLVSLSGARVGARYEITAAITRVGRGAENDIVVQGPDAATVSLRHFEICLDGDAFRIRDLESTNGTFVDGEQITEAPLSAPATIQLGKSGPMFSFVIEQTPDLNQTVMAPQGPSATLRGDAPSPLNTYDGLLTHAVARARRARVNGIGNETMMIMREALDHALRRSNRRSRQIIVTLAVVLLAVSGLAGYKILQLREEKTAIDRRIQDIEDRLARAGASSEQTEALIRELDVYQGRAERLERAVLYRFITGEQEDTVTREIRTLMTEFGAEVYSVPPEFVVRVKHYLAQYQKADRPHMENALTRGKRNLQIVRNILVEEQLPPDLAYIPVVESALSLTDQSAAGAAGLWQFTPSTARGYGLRVDSEVDERLDVRKSTRAGCRYLRELILDFGAGSSVMLALAAYNSGPGKVKRAVMTNVRDPIKQRNFWYLYRVRALPAETREYVPKVIAVMIIGRNPKPRSRDPVTRTAARLHRNVIGHRPYPAEVRRQLLHRPHPLQLEFDVGVEAILPLHLGDLVAANVNPGQIPLSNAGLAAILHPSEPVRVDAHHLGPDAVGGDEIGGGDRYPGIHRCSSQAEATFDSVESVDHGGTPKRNHLRGSQVNVVQALPDTRVIAALIAPSHGLLRGLVQRGAKDHVFHGKAHYGDVMNLHHRGRDDKRVGIEAARRQSRGNNVEVEID
jgi:pSer/pThr/pTyr-binding forkhead associated (FHA) protein